MPDPVLEKLGDIHPIDTTQGPLHHLAKPGEDASKFGPEEPFKLFDSSWAKNAFFVGGDDYDANTDALFNLYRSTADYTWQDTTPGGNIAVNPRHQYTRYSDPKRKGILPNRKDQTVSIVDNNLGMGRLYSEYLQDAAETTFIRVGIIENTSLINFLTSYGDPELTRIHIQGRHSLKFSGAVGGAIGAGGAFVLTAWVASPLVAFLMAGGAIAAHVLRNSLLEASTDFYVLKPLMHLYWLAVNSFVNTMLMEEGFILPKPGDKSDTKGRRPADADSLAKLGELYPELFTVSKGIDVAAVMARSALRWQAATRSAAGLMKAGTSPSMRVKLGEHTIKEMVLGSDPATAVDKNGITLTLTNIWNGLATSQSKKPHDPGTGPNKSVDGVHQQMRLDEITAQKIRDSVEKTTNEKVQKGDTTFLQYGRTEWDMGSAFATFRFDVASGLSDSFSNSTAPSNLAGVLNSAAEGSRAITHEFGGVRTDKNAIMDALKGVNNFVGQLATDIAGGANAFFLNVPSAVSTVLAGANVTIPDHWDSSDQQIATVTYTTTLITTSQHPRARTMDLMLPLAMMVGLVAARQVGPSAYTGPFMVSAYTRGKSNIKLGIVDRMTIDREVTNQKYDKYGRPMAFRVSLSIKDLTPVAAMLMPSPVPETSVSEELKMTSGDSVFNRWVRTLAGRGIEEDFFFMDRASNRIAQAYNIAGGRLSKARLAGALYDAFSSAPGFVFSNALHLNSNTRAPDKFN